MKIPLKNKKSKNAWRASVSFLHRVGRDAYLDWALIVLTFFALIAVSAAVAYFSFNRESVDDVSANSARPGSGKVIFDEQALNRVLKIYDERSAERERLKKGYSGSGDPSI